MSSHIGKDLAKKFVQGHRRMSWVDFESHLAELLDEVARDVFESTANAFQESQGKDTVIMALCEQQVVVLKPSINYIFVPYPHCDKCATIAKACKP